MLGFFGKRKQDWSARVTPAGARITVKAGENLLRSALEAGLRWPHDCRVGSCGTCRCTLKEGQVKELSDFSYVLTQEQLRSGMILACQAALRSDVVVEVDLEQDDAPTAGIVTQPALIHSVRHLTHDIVELVLLTDQDMPRTARAGQYAELTVDGIARPRSYSFAKAPENESAREITFFVRHVPGGEFTDWLFSADRAGEPAVVSGPYGSFWLRSGAGTIVCVAGGSGLAPVKALLESALNAGCARDVLFVFGARTQKDLYCLDAIDALRENWKGGFEFVPVLSDEPADSGWEGARGLCTDHFKRVYVDGGKLDLATSQGYLCGPPPMIDKAVELLTAAGMPRDEIHFDKFLDASSIPGGRK